MTTGSHIQTIRQKMAEATDFNGVHPPEEDDHFKADGVYRNYFALADGGLFDFDQDSCLEVKRIQLDLGSATTWKLELLSEDSEGKETVHTLYSESDFGGNAKVTIHGRTLAILHKNDKLKLTCSGVAATEFPTADITASRWG